MPRTLDVYISDELCGYLKQLETGLINFSYTTAWLTAPHSKPLSHSLPLREAPFTAQECNGFFGGLLPEAAQHDLIAHNLGISKKNNFAMLEKIGGECAGAVSFVTHGESLPTTRPDYRPLKEAELAEVLRQLPRRPLLSGEPGIRLSLAGAQSKLAVHVEGNTISLPLAGAPSTHLLKPSSSHFPTLISNEAFCMRLANKLGLNVASAEMHQAEGLNFLLVERYDRNIVADQGDRVRIQRLHQEDFCQALGITSELKYQNEGGPSLRQCFQLIRSSSDLPLADLQALLDAVIFNFLIGNNDAHGKNFSLLYREKASGWETMLAPLYDLISTAFYPELSRKMAMKIGSQFGSAKVLGRHFRQMADEVDISPRLTTQRVQELATLIPEALPDLAVDQITQMLASEIHKNCERTLRRLSMEPAP